MPEAAPESSSGGTIWALQYLRFVASAMVVVLHASGGLRQAGYRHLRAFDLGNAGVDVFFVISGFVIAWATRSDRPISRRRYFRARAVRILPLYLAATVLAALVLRGGENAGGFAALARALVFLPTHVAGTSRFTSVYGPAWTLAYEVFFYAAFGLALCLALRRRVLVVGAVFVALVAAGQVFSLYGLPAFYTDPLLLEFVAGMLLALAVQRVTASGLRLPGALLVSLHAAGWAALLLFGRVNRDELGAWRVVRWGIPALLIVATAVLLSVATDLVPRSRLLAHLGDASYATYMTHLFVIRVGGELWQRAGLTHHVPAVVLGLALVAAAVVAGSAADRWFDRPIRARLAGAR